MPTVRPPVFPSVVAYRSSPSAPARPRFSPIEPPPRTPRLTDTQDGEKNGDGFCPVLDLPYPIQSCCLFQFQFLARPPLVCSSRLACFGLFPRPRPGDVRAAAWLVAAGSGAACLCSRVPCRSLAAARSLVAICPASLVSLLLSRGVVGHFAGYSARFLVGVGIFKYMPLNGILWLLMGIFGDGVRYPFSALPVASFSPICPASCPLPAAVSWRWRRCFPAVSW